jgi:hypothetical protein
MLVVDTSEPSSPTVIGITEPLDDVVRDIALVGDYAIVVAGSSALVFDIRNKTEPTYITDFPYAAKRIVVRGQYGYVVGPSDLSVIDLTVPAAPSIVGQATSDQLYFDVAVSGTIAYVVGYKGLTIYDISSPDSPVPIRIYSDVGYAYTVGIVGSTAIVGKWDTGIVTVDVADPSDPSITAAFPELGSVRGISVTEPFAYIASLNAGVQLLDFSNPGAPVLRGYSPANRGIAEGVCVK